MEDILVVLPFLVLLVLIWLTYLNISFGVTIFKAKKEDQTLESCLNTVGKYFYIGLLIIYVGTFITCFYFIIASLLNGDTLSTYSLYLNILAVVSIIVSFLFQQIIYVGHRQILIGKIKFDYRKIKRVSFPKATKLAFVYGQKQFTTSLRFIDDFKIKKALQKAR